MFYSHYIKEAVDRVSQIMGLPRSHILPLKSYESEMELEDGISSLALMALEHILRFADDYMYNYLDSIEEGKIASKLCSPTSLVSKKQYCCNIYFISFLIVLFVLIASVVFKFTI